MGLSFYNIKKWTKMLTGKSIMHVNQDMGRCFVPGDIKGYFNNLTEKVLKEPQLLEKRELPKTTDEKAGNVVFPVAIFQYGLGAYDLYLQTGELIYKEQFYNCVMWAMKNQEESGAWNNFGFISPDAPYGSMAQGEGASLLMRAYRDSEDEKYLDAAKKAVDFMLLPIDKGGTAKYEKDDLYLCEFTNKPVVLNGWIFSLFGIYDLNLATNGYKSYLSRTIDTLKRNMGAFDNGYWSMYDMGGRIASPFYHNLHIAQLEALYKAFGDDAFIDYQNKFEKYRNNSFNKNRAFIVKAVQKLGEK